jgi:hypothetical protein
VHGWGVIRVFVAAACVVCSGFEHLRGALFDLSWGEIFPVLEQHPDVSERVFDHPDTIAVEQVFDGLQLAGSCRHRLPERLVDVIHVDVQADGGAAQGAGVPESLAGVSDHHGRPSNPDLGVDDGSVWCGDPEDLRRSQCSPVELDRRGGAVDHQMRDYGVLVALRDRLHRLSSSYSLSRHRGG